MTDDFTTCSPEPHEAHYDEYGACPGVPDPDDNFSRTWEQCQRQHGRNAGVVFTRIYLGESRDV